SPDGTVLLAHSEDLHLRSFVLPPDLLTSPPPLALNPYSTIGPIQSHTQAIPPYFSLSDPTTTHVLVSLPDLPLRLTNALDLSHVHATYPLVHGSTEAFIAPHSLVFSADGTRFAAGSKARISIFDLARDAQGPASSISTAQERRRTAGSGLHGYIIALDACPFTGQLAGGSTGGQVGIYDAREAGREVVSFDAEQSRGVGQVKWIGEGTYLAVAGRKSQGLALWDLRMARRLCWLAGRKGGLAMRMGFDVQQTEGGCHVLAGGTDGVVRVWKDVASCEGTRLHEEEWKAHDDAVTSVLAHPCGDVVITAGGSR
ncbi:WD40-repeat-containing domain protein, partial [Elsinoe ampelina]